MLTGDSPEKFGASKVEVCAVLYEHAVVVDAANKAVVAKDVLQAAVTVSFHGLQQSVHTCQLKFSSNNKKKLHQCYLTIKTRNETTSSYLKVHWNSCNRKIVW